MSRPFTFAVDEFYHLYNRGVDKRVVFENNSDYKRFALLLYLCNGNVPVHFEHLPNWRGSTSPELIEMIFGQERGNPLVAVGAYCLMPNHFHLLVREVTKDGISTFMQKLSTAYTMYFNAGRTRTGALFGGRFKAKHLNTDNQLKYLFSYIHLNPVKLIVPNWKEAGIKNKDEVKRFLAGYAYSSFMDYAGAKREFLKILEKRKFPDYFPKKISFENCINDWLTYRDDG